MGSKLKTFVILVTAVFCWSGSVSSVVSDSFKGENDHWIAARKCASGYTYKMNTDGSSDCDDYGMCCPEPGDGWSFKPHIDTREGKVWTHDHGGSCWYENNTTHFTEWREYTLPDCPLGSCKIRQSYGTYCVGYGAKGGWDTDEKLCDPLAQKEGEARTDDDLLEYCATQYHGGGSSGPTFGNCWTFKNEELTPCADCEGIITPEADRDLIKNPSSYCDLQNNGVMLNLEEAAAIGADKSQADIRLGTKTALGCLPTTPIGFVNWLVGYAMGLLGIILVFRFIQGGIVLMFAADNPEKIQEGREILMSVLIGGGVMIGSVALLQFLGVNVLQITDFETLVPFI